MQKPERETCRISQRSGGTDERSQSKRISYLELALPAALQQASVQNPAGQMCTTRRLKRESNCSGGKMAKPNSLPKEESHAILIRLPEPGHNTRLLAFSDRWIDRKEEWFSMNDVLRALPTH